uniref:Exocyst complex component 7 n=1 Tax=Plectus sambesii TaxID=2011161 RepID=A0A914WPU8_9BILA
MKGDNDCGLGYRRAATQAIDHYSDVPGDKEAETFLLSLGCFVALLQLESDLLSKTLANVTYEAKIQRVIVIKPLKFVLQHGENLCELVKLAISRQECASVLCVLPVARYLHARFTQLDSLAKNADSEVYAKFSALFRNIDALCVKGLEEFVETIKSDQDRFVPRDGTVHQVTSNALSFLKQLMEQRQALAVVLSDGPVDPAKIAVAKLFARILSALGLNLRNKAEVYQDLTLKSIFMLNNHNHILKTLHESGVLKVVCEQNREVEGFYRNQVTEYVKQYMNCWNKVTASFVDFASADATAMPAGSLSDREKDALKSAFSAFNRELESLTNIQKEYTVADLELSNMIKHEAKTFVMPKYTAFYSKYYASGFSRNPEKYVKFTPESVGMIIDRLFDATA